MKYWIFNPQTHPSKPVIAEDGIGSLADNLKLPEFAKHNLGFIILENELINGAYTLRLENGLFFYRMLRKFPLPLQRSRLARYGLAKMFSRISLKSENHGFSFLSRYEFRSLLNAVENLNRPKDHPLQINARLLDGFYRLFITSESLPVNLSFAMRRDLEQMRRAGQYLMSIKQKLQEASGQKEKFARIVQELIESARSLTTTVFASKDDWNFFEDRSIVVATSTHGFFPWELTYFNNQFVSLSRNFSRKQYWRSDIYIADKLSRKKKSLSFVFLDALQNESSLAEWREIRDICRLYGLQDVDYIAVNSSEDILQKSCRYAIVHIAAHGELKDNQIAIKIEREYLGLHPDNFLMPMPLVMVAHVCASGIDSVIAEPSFPAHHFLLPDIRIKEGNQRAFLQTFYLNILQKNSIGQSVRLARMAAFHASEDPFAFLYYGNGELSLKNQG